MASPAQVTPQELREALTTLALQASVFARGRGMLKQRRALMQAIKATNAALRASDVKEAIPDPETYIHQFIAAGGNWQDLAATVNRHALDGSLRKNK